MSIFETANLIWSNFRSSLNLTLDLRLNLMGNGNFFICYLLLAASAGRWHQARACHNSAGNWGCWEALLYRGRLSCQSIRWTLLVWTAKNRLVPDPLHPFPECVWYRLLLLDSCKCKRTPQRTEELRLKAHSWFFSLFARPPTVSTPASWTTSHSSCRGSSSGNSRTF